MKKRRLNMEYACCDLIQDLSFCLFSKIVNIKIYSTIILSVVLYGCETKQHIEVTYEEDADEDI
jgi:hypothetical protein